MDDTSDAIESFNEYYRIVESVAVRRAEMRVIGSDYGATSYTTTTQADRMARLLELGPGKVFLDIGSGSGWPGIYLAQSTGSWVVLTDLPLEGLRVASRRMRQEGVEVGVLSASGDSLPFRGDSFDAATSADVFC